MLFIIHYYSSYPWESIYGPRGQDVRFHQSTVACQRARLQAVVMALQEKHTANRKICCMYGETNPNRERRFPHRHAFGSRLLVLTISRHQTQRLPDRVLIFLWHTLHLLDLQSALIQSWAATWGSTWKTRRRQWWKRSHDFTFYVELYCIITICMFECAYYFYFLFFLSWLFVKKERESKWKCLLTEELLRCVWRN